MRQNDCEKIPNVGICQDKLVFSSVLETKITITLNEENVKLLCSLNYLLKHSYHILSPLNKNFSIFRFLMKMNRENLGQKISQK